MKLFGKEFTFNGFEVFHKGNKPNKTDVGLGNVDNVKQYSASNKPTPADIGAEPAFTKNSAFNKSFGTTAGTVCQGDDSRLSDARTPKAHTHTKVRLPTFRHRCLHQMSMAGQKHR